MALIDSLRTYVNTAAPGRDARTRLEMADAMLNSGAFYLDSGGTLCVRANSAAAGNIGTSTLTTRISSTDKTTLDSLRRLADVGLVNPASLFDQAAGVTVQVIP